MASDDENRPEGQATPALPEEVVNQLQKLAAGWTNDGITNRLSSWEKRQEKKFEELLSKKLDSFAQTIRTPSPKKGKDEDGSSDPVAYNSLQAEMQELKAKYAQAEASAKASKSQVLMSNLRKMAEQEFVANGGDPNMSEYALDHLIDAKKRLVVEEDGDDYRFVFKKEDGTEIDPKTGIKEFMKSEKGKPFSKAKVPSGSGSRITNNFTTPRAGGVKAAEQYAADVIFGGFGSGKINE